MKPELPPLPLEYVSTDLVSGDIALRHGRECWNAAIEWAAKQCDAIQDEYNESEHHKYPELKTDAEYCAGQCVRAILEGKR
jgi:hypothetical protein